MSIFRRPLHSHNNVERTLDLNIGGDDHSAPKLRHARFAAIGLGDAYNVGEAHLLRGPRQVDRGASQYKRNYRWNVVYFQS